jgi:D-serine deaminase-like pyridoxal phosphate-dependent protein
MDLHDLSTPFAVLDLDIAERNARFMGDRARELGVDLRPHVKTSKCPQLARIQVQGHSGGITVSTLAEAHAFFAAGFTDQTWALPLPLSRADEALRLAKKMDLKLLVDQRHTVDALSALAKARGQNARVLVKVDCGYHRAGVDPTDPKSVALVRHIADEPNLELVGVLTHGGHSYDCVNADEVRIVAAQERDVTTAFAERLRADGLEVPVVSVGSTPTCTHVDHLDGVTEIRPGNYIFYDLDQVARQTCSIEDVAMYVVASVIGRYDDRMLLDAGALALSRDPGPGPDFGLLQDLDGQALHGLRLVGLSQEHGKVRGHRANLDRVRVLPNHSCLTAAAHSELVVVRGRRVIDRWPVAQGW